jgi:hypothetical protein
MSAEVHKLLDIPMRNYKEWELFDAEINQFVQRGLLERIAPVRCIHIHSEEWYLDPSDGEIYVYVKPDDKIYPSWERVEVFAEPPLAIESRDLRAAGLKLISTGPISKEIASFLKTVLDSFAQEGRIEILPNPERPDEIWCKEYSTDAIYRLIADEGNQDYRWERVSANDGENSSAAPN